MTTDTVTPYRSTEQPADRDGFLSLVRSEWTKFRTVRGWLVGMGVAAVLTILMGLLGPLGSNTECASSNGQRCTAHIPPLGPDGQPVSDMFSFVRQAVAGDGSLTARLTSLDGYYSTVSGEPPTSTADMTKGLQPWARAGLVVKESITPGAPYVAVVVTGAHGVRLESNFKTSKLGSSSAVPSSDAASASAAPAVAPRAPRWLRLTRTGDTFTGYESADGVTWAAIGSVSGTGIPSSAQAGILVSSPEHTEISHVFGSTDEQSNPSLAVAAFDTVGLAGGWTANSAWTAPSRADGAGHGAPVVGNRFEQTGDVFTLYGSGDTAPGVAGPGSSGKSIENGLIGVFAGLIALIVVATLFITSEYRRGLIRTTLAATPRRGRVLAAKSIVIGAVAFVTGLIATGTAVPLVAKVERDKNLYVLSVPTATELRVIVGTAALLGVVAVFALAVGTMLRRGAGAVTSVIVVVVLPYVLAIASVLPTGTAQWLLRLTPAAGFAVQQSSPEYRSFAEVVPQYTPANGYYPLAPWAGFAVTCAYAAAALGLAVFLIRRRDA